jgi:hypothetical protein
VHHVQKHDRASIIASPHLKLPEKTYSMQILREQLATGRVHETFGVLWGEDQTLHYLQEEYNAEGLR